MTADKAHAHLPLQSPPERRRLYAPADCPSSYGPFNSALAARRTNPNHHLARPFYALTTTRIRPQMQTARPSRIPAKHPQPMAHGPCTVTISAARTSSRTPIAPMKTTHLRLLSVLV